MIRYFPVFIYYIVIYSQGYNLPLIMAEVPEKVVDAFFSLAGMLHFILYHYNIQIISLQFYFVYNTI